MNNWLLFLLKSTLVLSLLYLFFRLLMRNETFFRISRSILLFIVFASVVIPFVHLPHSNQYFVSNKLNSIFQGNTIFEKPVKVNEATPTSYSSLTNSKVSQPIVLSTKSVLLFIYLTGAFISFLIFVFNILSVLQLHRKSRRTTLDGMQIMIHNEDIQAFSFMRCIFISRHDYDTNVETILTHEISHIRQKHYFDVILLELVKIIYWFNPLVYLMSRNLKEIHEFQADEYTINSGVDSTKYQLLIIQRSVGRQSFALANNFNHCQIKKRITMMNKQKTSKAWRWKVTTFLPLLALLLMAFGKMGENVPKNRIVNEKPDLQISSVPIISQNEGLSKDRIIQIKSEGNYIGNKLCTLGEIISKGKEWYNASNAWILLKVDRSTPYNRVDEVWQALTNAGVYHITQSVSGSGEIIYPSGDVTSLASFKEGKWSNWVKNELDKLLNNKYDSIEYSVFYGFIIDKNGKVRDGRIIQPSKYEDINATYEKILSQIPDWKPALRNGKAVSVFYTEIRSQRIKKVGK